MVGDIKVDISFSTVLILKKKILIKSTYEFINRIEFLYKSNY